MDRLASILVGVDFSACSADAYREAARIASWNNATLSVLHVVAPPTPPAMDYMPHGSVSFAFATGENAVAAARERWASFADASNAPRPPAPPAFDIEIGSPRERILERVRTTSPDLLVLGSHSVHDARKGLGPTAAACAGVAMPNPTQTGRGVAAFTRSSSPAARATTLPPSEMPSTLPSSQPPT